MMQLQVSELAVELPGGLIDGDGHRLSQAKIRALTGAQEDWLAANPDVPSVLAVSSILSSCLVQLDNTPVDEELVGRLLVGDRDYLMLQLRRITLGEQVHAVLSCSACSAKMDVDFRVGDVPVEFRRQTATVYTVDCGGRLLRFRLPVGRDQEAVLGMNPGVAANALLERCLVRDGETELSPEECSAVVDAMDRLAPQVDLELDLTCPECAHSFVAPFDTTGFFLHELRLTVRRLLHEAHLLAFYYHWSEAEIMGLRRDRRMAYLALLSDHLRPA